MVRAVSCAAAALLGFAQQTSGSRRIDCRMRCRPTRRIVPAHPSEAGTGRPCAHGLAQTRNKREKRPPEGGLQSGHPQGRQVSVKTCA